MKKYQGTIKVQAEPMSYLAFKSERNEPVVSMEDQEGYKVIRHMPETGGIIKIFWLPKDQFEAFYTEIPEVQEVLS